MPTGYTAAVESGEITTLREFALLCARAMGACINMRDAPLSVPIPDRFEPHTEYNDKRLADARALMAEVDGLSDTECNERAASEFAKEMAAYDESLRREQERSDRYESMMAKVRKWHTEAEGLREFMLEQLRISMSTYSPMLPQELTGTQWRAVKKREALHDISYHEKAIADEIHRTAGRNNWLADLRLSLAGIDD